MIEDTDVILKSIPGKTGVFSMVGNTILKWCADNNIEAFLIGASVEGGYDISIWRIRDEKDRLLFKLTWEGKIING